MGNDKSVKDIWFLFYSLILSILVVFISVKYPFFNWDIVPYIGSVLSIDHDLSTIHQSTYQILREGIPESAFHQIVGSGYQRDIYENADYFIKQLNFYYVKPGYIATVYVLSLMGFSMIGSFYFLSCISVIGSVLLAFFWLKKYVNTHFSFLLLLLVGFQSRLFDLSRVATPDALSVLLLLSALFIFFEKKMVKLSLSVFLIAIFVRSNNIIFITMFVSYLIILDVYLKRFSDVCFKVIMLFLSVVSYFSISHFSGSYGWWTLFYHSFIGNLNQPELLESSFSVPVYLSVLVLKVKALLVPGISSLSTILVFLSLSVLYIAYKFKLSLSLLNDRYFILSVLIVLNYIAYFLLFPGVIQWDRFFTAFYMFSFIALARLLSKQAGYQKGLLG